MGSACLPCTSARVRAAFAAVSRHGFADSVKSRILVFSFSIWSQSLGGVLQERAICSPCQNQPRSELLLPVFQSTIPTAGPSDRYSCKKGKTCLMPLITWRPERIVLVTTRWDSAFSNATHSPEQLGDSSRYGSSMQDNLFEHSVNSQTSFSVGCLVADVGLSCQQEL